MKSRRLPPGSLLVLTHRHLAAFEHALALSDTVPAEGESPSALKSPPFTPLDAPEWSQGVEKLTATSDFAVSTWKLHRSVQLLTPSQSIRA